MTDQHSKDLGDGPRTVAIDFDGVIHSYVSGWVGGPENCPDPPVPGAAKAIQSYLDAGFHVAVYSTRAETLRGRGAILQYLEALGFPATTPNLSVSSGKPIAVMYIDDRGYQFQGRFPDPNEVKLFKPWKLGA